MLKAINKKNQSVVNKVIKAIIKYNEYDNLRNQADDNDNTKDHKKYERLCEKTYNDFMENMNSLPKNQQQAIFKWDAQYFSTL